MFGVHIVFFTEAVLYWKELILCDRAGVCRLARGIHSVDVGVTVWVKESIKNIGYRPVCFARRNKMMSRDSEN